uniref:Gustatory receptor 36a n=1 Tax=Drosophila rhopaloa TaxID=1041015 RepID=A0A6P4FG38_DRORH
MQITGTIIRLILASPNIMRSFRRNIYMKIFTGFATVLLEIAVVVYELNRVSFAQVFLLPFQLWAACILNLAMSQNSLLMLFVRAQYHVVHTELRKVMEKSRSLSKLPRRRAFIMSRCCDLADQVDDIAKRRSQLQSIISQLAEVSGIQWVMVFCDNYLWSVYFFYQIYTFFKYGQVNMNSTANNFILDFTACFFYYLDVYINLSIMRNVLNDDKKILRLMEERTLFGSVLNVRLEQSV